MTMKVGFIGLGTMGLPMVANLSKAGVPLVVQDASEPAATQAGRLAGVTVARSAADVAAQVEVLFTCLPNNDILRAVYLGPGGIDAGARAGLNPCERATGGPEATVQVARAL